MSLDCLVPIPGANKKRPQPGEDGYGRLVRAQQGRGGVIIRMPSNCEITRTSRKSSSLRCAGTRRSARMCKGIAEPNFAWVTWLRENYERSPQLGN